MRRLWLVRDYEPFPESKPTNWDDVAQIYAEDEHAAAETHARRQCAGDPDCYSNYESGKFLEVKESSADTSALVSVSVSFDPHFSSRIERTLT